MIDPARALAVLGEPVADRRRLADRREAPRIKMPKVQAEIAPRGLPATVLEIGLGGLSISSESEFSVGEFVDLSCTVGKHAPTVLRLEARHCRPDAGSPEPARYVTGFQFREAWAPGDHSAMDTLMERLITVLSVDRDR